MIGKSSRSEIRKDYIQDKYVIIAPRRADRPAEPGRTCAFCSPLIGREKSLMTIGGKKDWRIKVVANKFPSVTKDNPKAFGIQEIAVDRWNATQLTLQLQGDGFEVVTFGQGFKDMTALVTSYPQLLGIGIDEATALIVQGHVGDVLGRGQVHFYDRRKPVEEGKPDYESVGAGGQYDLKARKVTK